MRSRFPEDTGCVIDSDDAPQGSQHRWILQTQTVDRYERKIGAFDSITMPNDGHLDHFRPFALQDRVRQVPPLQTSLRIAAFCNACSDAGSPFFAIPAAWTCTPSYFAGDDGCDCGCGALDPDCVGGGCAEASCGTDDEICRFCYDDTGTSIPNCGREGEGGEGEGEGEGNGGEGEGEGEGEGNNANGLGADPDVDEGGAGCASTPVSSSAMVALTGIAFAIARRRRR